jgi:PAS domain S-box-containing protein/putative nucleotidyltransferase with HDIG domain
MPDKHTPSSDPTLRYTRLFEAAQDGILLLSFPEGFIEDANPYILDLIGYTKEELLGKELWQIGLLSDKEKAIAAHNAIIKEGFVRCEDIDFLTKSGQQLPVEIICNSYHVDGDVVVQCNIRNISDRKKAEAERALEQARNITQLQETISSLSNVIEARDPFTAGHQKRVADLACEIAKELKVNPSEIEGLKMACLIHDIGKIGIPSEILTKPSTLTPLEIAILRGHAQAGYEILKPLNFPWPVAKFVLQHHERLNGSGYPNAIKGDAICLEARIMAVADTVEAMSSDRPYRPAVGVDSALKEIDDNRDTLFDGAVVDACLRLFREQGYKFPPANALHSSKSNVRGGKWDASLSKN